MKNILLLALLGLLATSNAYAKQDYEKDIQVISNSLKYISGVANENGTYVLGAVYSQSLPDSKAAAESFVSSLNSSEQAQKVKLKAKLISVADIGSNSVNIAYVMSGLSSQHAEIYAAAKKSRVLTLSSDVDCAKAKCCVLAIKTDGSVEIFLNEITMRDLGFEVDAAFKFMVKRL